MALPPTLPYALVMRVTVLQTVVVALSITAGLFCTLMLLTLFLVGGANMKPEDVPAWKGYMLAICVGGVACAVGAFFLLRFGLPGWGVLAGIFPGIFMIGLFIWAGVR
jgi:hypothetical protein